MDDLVGWVPWQDGCPGKKVILARKVFVPHQLSLSLSAHQGRFSSRRRVLSCPETGAGAPGDEKHGVIRAD